MGYDALGKNNEIGATSHEEERSPQTAKQETLTNFANTFYAAALIMDTDALHEERQGIIDLFIAKCVASQQNMLERYPESEWGIISESAEFKARVRDLVTFRKLILSGNNAINTSETDLLAIADRFRTESLMDNGQESDDLKRGTVQKRIQQVVDSAKKYGVKPTLYALITNMVPYIPPAYAAAFTVGGESTWFTKFIEETGIPEYDFLVKLGYLFAVIEATTTPIPMVPGVAGITRLLSYAIVEGVITGERNHRSAIDAGRTSLRRKKVLTSIALGLPVTIDFGYLAIPIMDKLRTIDMDVEVRSILVGYRLNQLLKKYSIDLINDIPYAPVVK